MEQEKGYHKCCKCPYEKNYENCHHRQVIYTRVDNLSRSFQALKERAGVENLQVKDLRTYFNHRLKQHCGFSSKEAGVYIGNSEAVNEMHYTPVSWELMRDKIGQKSLNAIVGIGTHVN